VNNADIFSILDTPTGNCSIVQPQDHNGQMVISCEVSSNPPFVAATWTLHSTQTQYYGYPQRSGSVRTYYAVSIIYS